MLHIQSFTFSPLWWLGRISSHGMQYPALLASLLIKDNGNYQQLHKQCLWTSSSKPYPISGACEHSTWKLRKLMFVFLLLHFFFIFYFLIGLLGSSIQKKCCTLHYAIVMSVRLWTMGLVTHGFGTSSMFQNVVLCMAFKSW